METRPVLRVFISSTSVDLIGYREKVRDAILNLEDLPIAMESFSAQSGQPASECIRMAAESDALVCIVAYRYGYVPPKDLGGDGERSITWLEVDSAKHAEKPVFAFLVDPQAEWTQQKEQDRLVSEPEKASEIVKAVQKLQEFKAYLEREHTRKIFKNQDELATLVTATLAKLARQPDQKVISTTRVWTPLFCHALQPAQHFRGRQTKLQELKTWLIVPVTPDRVVSVVAAGGTGKTALVHRALKEATLSDRAGVFVWSFYEDPHTDAFLRAAYLYFTGEKETPAGGMLERLQLALSGAIPHVLVLDGLERVQSEGAPRRRGELEDLQLKRLIRALAGGIGAARALVTSRFPLVDLDEFTGAGHRAITLDDLELPVALDVLRAWNVQGDDAALKKLIEPLNTGGFYHALSVAVLGSYIGNFGGGDPAQAPEFSLEDAKESDPKARRLSRILEQYAKALTPVERDLLSRLTLFPRGVKIEFLGWIVQAGGQIGGALVGLANEQLIQHLERLRHLGLVFYYGSGQSVTYSAHPFLREFFRNLLGIKPESVHEFVRAKLAPNLEMRPASYPTDPTILDQYELLIEETLLSDRIQEAYELYWFGIGGFKNLGWVLGDSARALRILERFSPDGNNSNAFMKLAPEIRSSFLINFGFFAEYVGDLSRARRGLTRCFQSGAHGGYKSVAAQGLVDIELNAGRFNHALNYAENACSLAESIQDTTQTRNSLAFRASAQFDLGNIANSKLDFERATQILGHSLNSLPGLLEAERRLVQGDRSGALRQTNANQQAFDNAKDNLCRCNSLLARIILQEDAVEANRHLQEARAFANRSGNIDLQLRCFHAASEFSRHLGDHPQAIAEAEAGIVLADTCGFGKYSIDLRLTLAETLLAAGDAHKALQNARNALDRSEHTDCQYAWGKADGLHFCGLAHMRLGETELARQRLTAALELRERLGHGRLEETRRALASLPPPVVAQP